MQKIKIFPRLLSKNKNFYLVIAFIIVFGHSLALFSFGATFWVDSIFYVDLAYHMFLGQGLSNFYSLPMVCLASHFGPMISLLWGFIYSIFGSISWFIYAILQHAFAGISLFYLLMILKNKVNRIALLIATIILIFHPFYQSFHNMIMTESIASSIVILLAASSLFLVSESKNKIIHLAVFTTAGFMGILVRPQILLFAVAFLAYLLIVKRRNLLLYMCSVLILVSAYFLFPATRWVLTGQFYLPNIDCLSARSALMSSMGKETRASQVLQTYDLPKEIDPKLAALEGLSYDQSMVWFTHLSQQGLKSEEIRKVIRKAGNEIRFNSFKNVSGQIDAALSGTGLLHFSFFYKPSNVMSEGKTFSEWTDHYMLHYRWLSWQSDNDYESVFSDFVQRFTVAGWYHPQSIEIFNETVGPNILNKVFLNDPLSLSVFPPDVWVIGWFIGIFFLLIRREKDIAIILFIPVAVNYFTVLFVGFGNIRYSYIVVPVEIIATVVGSFFLFKKIRIWLNNQ